MTDDYVSQPRMRELLCAGEAPVMLSGADQLRRRAEAVVRVQAESDGRG
ncbi:hypothetical protein [Kribbella speibonae]|nr:hypothetical protein [Kribbella speibonae]